VQTAYQANLHREKDDTILLIHARNERRILLTFDQLGGEQGCKISRELRQNGGGIIQIKGGPSQDEYRIVGKLLFHYPDWNPCLIKQDGIVVISDIKHNCIYYTPRQYHLRYHQTDAKQFELYLLQRRLKKPRKKRRISIPKGQAPLNLL
jgi:hypothetical protein